MNLYLLIKTLHIISSTLVFGTGIGIAFFMLRAYFSPNIQVKYYASVNTVLADYLFTLPAVIVQPLSGAWLIWHLGYDWTQRWLLLSYAIYLIAGLCWLPVVWIQIQLKQMIVESLNNNSKLPDRYHRLFKLWFLLGWPAFLGLIIVFYLMVAKPI